MIDRNWDFWPIETMTDKKFDEGTLTKELWSKWNMIETNRNSNWGMSIFDQQELWPTRTITDRNWDYPLLLNIYCSTIIAQHYSLLLLNNHYLLYYRSTWCMKRMSQQPSMTIRDFIWDLFGILTKIRWIGRQQHTLIFNTDECCLNLYVWLFK